MQADNQPQAEESDKPINFLESSQRMRLGSGASIFKFLKSSILKPKQPTEIHSSSLSQIEGHSTLAPFFLAGVNVKRVNRDYEAFKGSAWVDPLETSSSTGVRGAQRSALGGLPLLPTSVRNEDDWNGQLGARGEEREGGRDRQNKFPQPLAKLRSKTNAEVVRDSSGREERSKPPLLPSPQSHRHAGILPPLPPAKKVPFMPPSSAGVGGSPGFRPQVTEVCTCTCRCAFIGTHSPKLTFDRCVDNDP